MWRFYTVLMDTWREGEGRGERKHTGSEHLGRPEDGPLHQILVRMPRRPQLGAGSCAGCGDTGVSARVTLAVRVLSCFTRHTNRGEDCVFRTDAGFVRVFIGQCQKNGNLLCVLLLVRKILTDALHPRYSGETCVLGTWSMSWERVGPRHR